MAFHVTFFRRNLACDASSAEKDRFSTLLSFCPGRWVTRYKVMFCQLVFFDDLQEHAFRQSL